VKYQSHWGMRDTPFRACHDPHFFYQSPTHDEALARLQFLVDQRRRLGLLMGPRGSGKSLVLEVFAAKLRRQGVALAAVNLTGVEVGELLWQLNSQLDRAPGRADGPARLWRLLSDRLREFRYQQLPVALLLDDADRASAEVTAQIARLAQWDRWSDLALTIVLAGRHDQMGRLGGAVLELSELRIDLEPWEPADTEQYLRQSLSQVGGSDEIFAPPAVAKIHELSGGIPRRISQLADLALVAGAGQKLQQIDADVVESVFHEFCLTAG